MSLFNLLHGNYHKALSCIINDSSSKGENELLSLMIPNYNVPVYKANAYF